MFLIWLYWPCCVLLQLPWVHWARFCFVLLLYSVVLCSALWSKRYRNKDAVGALQCACLLNLANHVVFLVTWQETSRKQHTFITMRLSSFHGPFVIWSYCCLFFGDKLLLGIVLKELVDRPQKEILNNLSNFLPNPSHPFFKTNIIKTLCAPGRCDLSPEMGLFWKNAFAELCSRTGDRKTGWLTLVNGYWAGGFKEPVEGSLRVLSEEKRSHETDETLFVLTSDWERRLSKCYKHTAVWS